MDEFDVADGAAEIKRLMVQLKANKAVHSSIQSANVVVDVCQGLLERRSQLLATAESHAAQNSQFSSSGASTFHVASIAGS